MTQKYYSIFLQSFYASYFKSLNINLFKACLIWHDKVILMSHNVSIGRQWQQNHLAILKYCSSKNAYTKQ